MCVHTLIVCVRAHVSECMHITVGVQMCVYHTFHLKIRRPPQVSKSSPALCMRQILWFTADTLSYWH